MRASRVYFLGPETQLSQGTADRSWMLLYLALILYRDLKPANALLDDLEALLWLYGAGAEA